MQKNIWKHALWPYDITEWINICYLWNAAQHNPGWCFEFTTLCMWAIVLNNKDDFVSVQCFRWRITKKYKDGVSHNTVWLTGEQTNTCELTDGVQPIKTADSTAEHLGDQHLHTHTHAHKREYRQAQPQSYCLHAGAAEIQPPPHALNLQINCVKCVWESILIVLQDSAVKKNLFLMTKIRLFTFRKHCLLCKTKAKLWLALISALRWFDKHSVTMKVKTSIHH